MDTSHTRITLTLRRDDLTAAEACAAGLALYDSIAALSDDPRAAKRLRVRWTLIHSLWISVAYPSHAGWLRDMGIVPLVHGRGADLSGADLSGADLRGAMISKSATPPAGWVAQSVDACTVSLARAT